MPTSPVPVKEVQNSLLFRMDRSEKSQSEKERLLLDRLENLIYAKENNSMARI